MGFWELLAVACNPIIQVLLVSAVGVYMASDKFDNFLSENFRRSLNKLVFIAFTPSLIFASFARSVSLDDMISWWFMPVNIGCTFVIGGFLGWLIVKLLKPSLKVEGLIIAACSTGNMGNLPVVIIPAICYEKGGPFGEREKCRVRALAYASFSLAVGGIFIWTFTYQLVRDRAMKYKAWEAAQILKIPNKNYDDANTQTSLLKGNQNQNTNRDTENQIILDQVPQSCWQGLVETVSQIVSELLSPPTVATFLGFIFGGVDWLRSLIIGEDAPLRVIQETIQLLGEGTIPCITILLGGNLTQGMKSSTIEPLTLISVVLVRLFLLPSIGLYIVRGAASLGFLPLDPLFQYVLVMQYAMPPAMNICTMTQLFDAGTEEASVITLWTYCAATISLTLWSTTLLYVLT
ncbi:protein PIN-LIKES 7-like [Arachis duranensis]|uniref:Protein PIN-LIKES 7-like n=1 Tax=Arachis duranensis TaxID=130453 RepID=A0A6P4CP36_ARADU|nr:protein PIN-LIKES 7-like [Arachis duranensis]XP_052112002.1 protein PIN-LIKES 7-like [Arachis duranensis]XP_057762505.1 protein PIN-LIKES 7-like [Arachis stenosperma]